MIEVKNKTVQIDNQADLLNFKHTKLGMVPIHWKEVLFKDIFDEVIEFTDDTEQFPLYSLTIEEGVIPKSERYERSFLITKEKENYKVVGKDEFVFNPMNLRFGALARLREDKKVSVSGYYNVFKIKNNFSPEFIEYYLKSERMLYLYNSYATGSLMEKQRVHFSQFINFKLPIPPVKEANKIGEILSTWDKAIELKEKLIKLKKEQKKGLMQKLLTGEIRLPGFNSDWDTKRINKISKVFRGASPRPISDSKWFEQNSQIGWVRISDVTKSNKYLQQTEQYLSGEGVKKSRLVEKGNLIMSICATVGKPIVTGFDVCIHDGFVVFNDLKINKDYFYYVLLNLENNWSKYGQTGSQMNLNTDIVGNEKIKFPKDSFEQQAIVDVLLDGDKEINLLEDELESIKLQKKGLMQLLLTGKIRVKV